jgi:hypothetical protein
MSPKKLSPNNLTSTQLVLLSAAAQREDGAIELAPNLKGGAADKEPSGRAARKMRRGRRCAAPSRKRSATRSPPRKWKVSTPSMARPTRRKSRSRKASRPRVPEGSASLSRRSCNHSP